MKKIIDYLYENQWIAVVVGGLFFVLGIGVSTEWFSLLDKLSMFQAFCTTVIACAFGAIGYFLGDLSERLGKSKS